MTKSEVAISAEVSILDVETLCHSMQDSQGRQSKFGSNCSRRESETSSADDQSEKPDDQSEKPATAPKIFKPASSKRQQLTVVEAAEIFELRPKCATGNSFRRGSMLTCKKIAPKYGVSPKTIRDIWRGRTWLHATEHLWTEKEREQLLRRGTTTNRIAAQTAEVQISTDSGADAPTEVHPLATATAGHNICWHSASTQLSHFADRSYFSAANPPAPFPTVPVPLSGAPSFDPAPFAPFLPAWVGLSGLRIPPPPPAHAPAAPPPPAALDPALLRLIAGGGLGLRAALPPRLGAAPSMGGGGLYIAPGLPRGPEWL